MPENISPTSVTPTPRDVIIMAAFAYSKRGWVLHPLSSPNDTGKNPGKRPILQNWQNRAQPATDEELRNWFSNNDLIFQDCNIGLVCGKSSNVTAIDFDKMLFTSWVFKGIEMKELNTLKSSRIPGRGHVIFLYTPDIRSSRHHDLGIEIFNDTEDGRGSNLVLPPSTHTTGSMYKFENTEAPGIKMPDKVVNNLEHLFKIETELKQLLSKCRHCFRDIIKKMPDMTGADGREYMLAVCTDLVAGGAKEDHIKMFATLMYGEKYDEDKTLTELKNIDPAKTWQCDTLRKKLPSYVDLEKCDECKKRDAQYKVKSEKGTINVVDSASRLLETCDGAVTKDGQGYNKFDAIYVRKVMSQEGEINIKQQIRLYELLEKYSGQLQELGIDYNNIEKPKETPKEKMSTVILKLLEETDTKIFHDQYKIPNAFVEINSHHEVVPIEKSELFKKFLTGLYYNHTKVAPGRDALNEAIGVCAAEAFMKEDFIELFNRCCFLDNNIYYQLSQDKVVVINENGWEVNKNTRPLFKTQQHQLYHNPSNISGPGKGDVHEILKFVNISTDNDKMLFEVHLVSLFLPHIIRPILLVYGGPGSAKSSTHQIEKKLVDPSILEDSIIPNKPAELIQLMSHQYFVVFDNLTWLQDWQSDIICKAVTGAGLSKRSLYSDDDDFIYKYRRGVGLNGINIMTDKSDLMDRAILLNVERIPKGRRASEKIFWERFEKVKGSILGGVFDTLVKTMKIINEIPEENLERLADFTMYGQAIAEALGYNQQEFLSAYRENIQRQNVEVLEGNLVGNALMNVLKYLAPEKSGTDPNMVDQVWEGTATNLLNALETNVDNSKVVKAKGWPKTAQHLTRRLNELKANMADLGIKYETQKSGNRKITMTRTSDPRNLSDDWKNVGEAIYELPTKPDGTDRIAAIRWCIKNLSANNKGPVDLKDIYDEVYKEFGINKETVDKKIASLKTSGEVIEPMPDHFRVM